MTDQLDILQLEALINRMRQSQPPLGGELSPELNVLAALYARMIFAPDIPLGIAELPPACRALLRDAPDAEAEG